MYCLPKIIDPKGKRKALPTSKAYTPGSIIVNAVSAATRSLEDDQDFLDSPGLQRLLADVFGDILVNNAGEYSIYIIFINTYQTILLLFGKD